MPDWIQNLILPIGLAVFSAIVTVKIENKKTQKEYQNYIKQKRMDKKFELLGELYYKATLSVGSSSNLYPLLDRLPVDEEDKKKVFFERYKRATEDYNAFSTCLIKSSPYIPKDIYEIASELRSNESYLIFRYEDSHLSGIEYLKIEADERKELRNRIDNCDSLLTRILEETRTNFDSD